MYQGANCSIGRNTRQQRKRAKQGIGVQKGCSDAADKANKGANGKIKVIDRDDEHLRYCGERNGHGILQHQVKAKIAHGAGLHIEYGAKNHSERNDDGSSERSRLRLMLAQPFRK